MEISDVAYFRLEQAVVYGSAKATCTYSVRSAGILVKSVKGVTVIRLIC